MKTQKRPYAVSFKLDCISGEVGFRWKGVSASKASQLRDTQHWITTSMSPVFKLCMVFSHGLGKKRPFVLTLETPPSPASFAIRGPYVRWCVRCTQAILVGTVYTIRHHFNTILFFFPKFYPPLSVQAPL